MKKYIILIFFAIVVSAVIAYSVYNKPHRSVDEETAISMKATALFSEFENNEADANGKYLDKVLEVSGIVSEVIKNQAGGQVIVLKTSNDVFGVSCTMEAEQQVSAGEVITIKGFCRGYLSDVVIDKGVVVK